MSERIISVSTYATILAILLCLTVVTVGVSLLPLEGQWHIAAGLTIAVVKASLVVLFFMHALDSPRLTWIIVAVAVAWLLILVSLTFSDYLSRGRIPFMPGH